MNICSNQHLSIEPAKLAYEQATNNTLYIILIQKPIGQPIIPKTWLIHHLFFKHVIKHMHIWIMSSTYAFTCAKNLPSYSYRVQTKQPANAKCWYHEYTAIIVWAGKIFPMPHLTSTVPPFKYSILIPLALIRPSLINISWESKLLFPIIYHKVCFSNFSLFNFLFLFYIFNSNK